MRNFGLPEFLMLFEIWQRSPAFLLKQVQMADVMKKDAESLLDLFTACFSSSAAVPELGLGNAETKVVQTAWNRHLILFNNATIYNRRSWTMQFVLYFLGICTTLLSILVSQARHPSNAPCSPSPVPTPLAHHAALHPNPHPSNTPCSQYKETLGKDVLLGLAILVRPSAF